MLAGQIVTAGIFHGMRRCEEPLAGLILHTSRVHTDVSGCHLYAACHSPAMPQEVFGALYTPLGSLAYLFLVAAAEPEPCPDSDSEEDLYYSD